MSRALVDVDGLPVQAARSVSELNEDGEIEAPRNAMPPPAAPGGGRQLGSPEYNRCLQQAGDDIAAVQQCARLRD